MHTEMRTFDMVDRTGRTNGCGLGPVVVLQIVSLVAISFQALLYVAEFEWQHSYASVEKPRGLSPCHSIQEGGFISQILLGEQTVDASCVHHDGRRRLKFRPGTLQLNAVESLRHCSINAANYGNHIMNRGSKWRSTVISEQHRLSYILLPKSASSTSRFYMTNYFNGTYKRVLYDNFIEDNITLVSFVREPLSRFYSSFDEAYNRQAPWHRDNNERDERYRETMPYTTLYNGATEANYTECSSIKGRKRGSSREMCDDVDTEMLRRFEKFVNGYDGTNPFDEHMNLQTMILTDGNGKLLPMAHLYDASEAEVGWSEIANRFGVTDFKEKESEMRARERPRRSFDISQVSTETKRKICALMSLDYCCLNFELPEDCRGILPQDDSTFCALRPNDGMHAVEKGPSYVIEPWTDA